MTLALTRFGRSSGFPSSYFRAFHQKAVANLRFHRGYSGGPHRSLTGFPDTETTILFSLACYLNFWDWKNQLWP